MEIKDYKIKDLEEYRIILNLYCKFSREASEPLTLKSYEQTSRYIENKSNYCTEVLNKLISLGILYPAHHETIKNENLTFYSISIGKLKYLILKQPISKMFYKIIRDNVNKLIPELYSEEDIENMENEIYG